ncbi:unnamed protein product [Ranitomeya imitator]|uniref:DNA topoisomerase 2 n=1 Tax=Ranitomeya imitator TaxID=111125 RepID=A0ABN9MCS0_9NEOB|nr:unnamed protein product [Ranitomeya imitator]
MALGSLKGPCCSSLGTPGKLSHGLSFIGDNLVILGGYLFVQTFTGQPRCGVVGDIFLPVSLLEEVVFQKLAVGLGVELHSILNPKRSHKFIFDTSPYQYPTSTLLASESEWSSLPFTDPASGPSRVTLISSSVHKTFEKSVLRNMAKLAMWVYDEDIGMNCRDITFVPGLYKIFDEILVNAADNKQRDKNMSCIKISIDPDSNIISIWNNGKGIPVVEHKVEKVYVPALIFGQLLTSSNYDDEEKKVAAMVMVLNFAIYSIWMNNMQKTSDPKIKFFDGDDYTCITFQPDLAKFNMEKLDKDTVALLTRRAYDVAGSCKGVRVMLNGKKLPINGFRSYVDLYVKEKLDETGVALKVVHELVNERWDVCLTLSEKGFQQISFVNSIATTKGGRHVDYVVDQIVSKLIEVVKKKNKAGVSVKPFQVKNHVWVFVNCLIENPSFDSQTKENMTLQPKSFGSKCPLSEKFAKAASNCGIVESILNWVKFKAQTQLNKKCSSVKHSKIKGIPKLDDANDAGGKHSLDCTLILTEGDSAKSLAVSGLGVIGRDRYGVFPLRGKILNVREASHKQIMENAEINNIIKIVGLQYKKSYDDQESLKSLRYGKIMIMTDQDQDGSHIKGLLINFFHHNWPSLLKHNFLEEFITPIVKATKNKQELSFYSIPEFDEWKKQIENQKLWKIKYYKGLGTSTSKEAKEYFADMDRHRIIFRYAGPEDDAAITLAFSKKKIDDRKEWLTNFMEDRRQRRLHGLPEQFLYGTATKHLSFNDFINKELILFSNSDNERSIPSLVDGFPEGYRVNSHTCSPTMRTMSTACTATPNPHRSLSRTKILAHKRAQKSGPCSVPHPLAHQSLSVGGDEDVQLHGRLTPSTASGSCAAGSAATLSLAVCAAAAPLLPARRPHLHRQRLCLVCGRTFVSCSAAPTGSRAVLSGGRTLGGDARPRSSPAAPASNSGPGSSRGLLPAPAPALPSFPRRLLRLSVGRRPHCFLRRTADYPPFCGHQASNLGPGFPRGLLPVTRSAHFLYHRAGFLLPDKLCPAFPTHRRHLGWLRPFLHAASGSSGHEFSPSCHAPALGNFAERSFWGHSTPSAPGIHSIFLQACSSWYPGFSSAVSSSALQTDTPLCPTVP